MFENPFKETKHLNSIDLSSIKGTRLYYSKVKYIINVVVFSLIMGLNLWLIFDSETSNTIVIFFIVSLLIFGHFLLQSISRLFHKNPLLILTGEKLYYLNNQEWYNLVDFVFEDRFYASPGGWPNLSRTFYMEDKNENKIFALNNWFLHNPDDFKRKLTYNRAMSLKAKHKL
jgi:hypothetical protein